MILKLNLNGSAEPFVNYLKNYSRIRESLLLEIDTKQRAFIAKTFTEDKSCVRFSSILFSDANMTIVSDDGEDVRGDKRIMVGILIQLKKFIQIVERFGSDSDAKGNADFNIIFNYSELMNEDKSVDFVAIETRFESQTLKMKMDGFRPSELFYLSDEKIVNSVFAAKDAITVGINSSTIASIIKTSEIVKMDPRKDSLIFYVEDEFLYVRDLGSGKDKQPNFVYKIGMVNTSPYYPIYIPVGRDRFITMMDKTTENFNLIIGLSPDPEGGFAVNRILFDSITSTTKIAIGGTKDH